MSSERSLYEKVILDHNKAPRNFGEMADSTAKAEGYNALCGDQFTVYVKMNGDLIDSIQFSGTGCAISKSSASVMTTLVEGKSRGHAVSLFEAFREMVTSEPGSALDADALGKLMIFNGVREYPMRIKCATLPWHTLVAALQGKEDAVSTE